MKKVIALILLCLTQPIFAQVAIMSINNKEIGSDVAVRAFDLPVLSSKLFTYNIPKLPDLYEIDPSNYLGCMWVKPQPSYQEIIDSSDLVMKFVSYKKGYNLNSSLPEKRYLFTVQ